MSGATRNVAFKQFQRALERWPKDPLRPDCQLQDVLAKRLEKDSILPSKSAILSSASREEAELKQANALFSLLENRYKTKYRITDHLLKPKSNPTYYTDIIRELEEAPTRSWLTRVAKKLGGIVRFT
ncbi:hypothetical protein B0T17DRAFT_512104 [Bombardia bombarda]|uniref:Ubiquinol-cytochrome-c reductase complex assembly factor 2 n=1 Tax=Bombardia bombarda TaxID=252184 RepID=A0AA39WCN4_9PEZI|nr:hypothetical protein B0T17DRAFT_512104 [Bombardia bombarda]